MEVNTSISSPTPDETPIDSTLEPQLSPTTLQRAVPPEDEMALIAGYSRYFGVEKNDPNGQESKISPKPLQVASFYLDRTEVTNADFYDFVSATHEQTPWRKGIYEPGTESQPVQGVWWSLARAYCQAVGKRLPSEMEWELAAAGEQLQPYSTGDAVPNELLGAKLGEVGSVAANNRNGVFDLSGNAPEWVSDTYDLALQSQNPTARFVKGGGNGFVRANTERDIALDEFDGKDFVGFRCAADQNGVANAGRKYQSYDPPSRAPTAKPGDDEGGVVVVRDDFSSNRYSWPTIEQLETEGRRAGRHPLHEYHIEITRNDQHMQVMYSLRQPTSLPYSVKLKATPVKTPVDFTFAYGVAFGSSQDGEDGYVLVVNPPAGTIALAYRKHTFAEGGTSRDLYRTIFEWQNRSFIEPSVEIEIRKDVAGSYQYFVDGIRLPEMTDDEEIFMHGALPESEDYAGMFVITYSGTSKADHTAHVHFESFEITEAS